MNALTLRLVEYHWVEARGHSGRRASSLHLPDLDLDDDPRWDELDATGSIDALLARCGRPLRQAQVPSLGARMEQPRCAQCCRAVGMPTGAGSPKNDPAARVVAEDRIASRLQLARLLSEVKQS
ncbi:hypothetical protein [Enterococcus hirae]|uniref:hypothetical protein n=1 Tax=Enterococcus hirae TaxID=1354 RepID=UPI0013720447|nr:hypothetical protein [Enterococcus hirae]NAE18216.1 hypothetical protein [Enterococcus hirae]